MPSFLDELLRRSQGGAGAFLEGINFTDRSPIGGLAGGLMSLGSHMLDPSVGSYKDVDAVTGVTSATRLEPGIRPVIDDIPLPEEPFTEEVELAPGIRTIGATPAVPPEEPTKLNPDEVRRLVANVGDPGGNISEVRLPDGTAVRGLTPDAFMGQERQITPTAEGGDAGNFLDFFGSPEFSYLAGRIAQAIVPDPRHGVNIAGGVGAELGINRAYGQYVDRLSRGESLESLEADRTFNILPPELKSNALKDVLSQERQAVSNLYTEQLIRQSQAATAATPTYQERFDHETMLAMIRNRTNMNLWQVWGYGQMRHKETGEIVKVPVPPRGTGSDPAVQNRQWYKQAYNEAVRSPNVLQYVKDNIVVGPDGTPVFQWTDPVKGQEALQEAMAERLKLFQAQGLVPPGYLDLVGERTKPKVEF